MTVNEAIQNEQKKREAEKLTVNQAINLLNHLECHGAYYEAKQMAIRSLDAWDKVINTLKSWSDAKVSPKQRDVYFDCIKLIEQTIKQEVQNDN